LFNPMMVSVRIEDVAPNGPLDRATVRRKKTGWSVRFEPRDQTRHAIVQNGSASAAPWQSPNFADIRPRSCPPLFLRH